MIGPVIDEEAAEAARLAFLAEQEAIREASRQAFRDAGCEETADGTWFTPEDLTAQGYTKGPDGLWRR